MRRTLAGRIVAVTLLLGVLFGLCVWYGTLTPDPSVGAYPTNDHVGPAPEAFVGGPVELDGDVVATDPVRIEVVYGDDQNRLFTVTDVTIPVHRGDKFRVFGTLTDRNTIRATNAFTVPPSGLVYTYGISFLSGLWVLSRLLLQWRFDVDRGLVRRTTPIDPVARFRKWTRASTGGQDA